MTLLTIAQNIARDAKTQVPSSIINNDQEVAKQLLSSIKLSTADVFEKYDWEVLQYEKTFSSVVSQANYDLPDDYSRVINSTFYNYTQQREVFLSSPREWRQLQLNINVSVYDRYRIRQNELYLYPTPTAIESFTYEYISNEIILDTNGTTKYTDWQADTDTALLNENLIELGARWRFLRMQGKEYAEAQREFDERFELIMGRDAGRRKIYPRNISYRYPNTLPQEITP